MTMALFATNMVYTEFEAHSELIASCPIPFNRSFRLLQNRQRNEFRFFFFASSLDSKLQSHKQSREHHTHTHTLTPIANRKSNTKWNVDERCEWPEQKKMRNKWIEQERAQFCVSKMRLCKTSCTYTRHSPIAVSTRRRCMAYILYAFRDAQPNRGLWCHSTNNAEAFPFFFSFFGEYFIIHFTPIFVGLFLFMLRRSVSCRYVHSLIHTWLEITNFREK